MATTSGHQENDPRTAATNGYRKKLLEHREMEAKVKDCMILAITRAMRYRFAVLNVHRKISFTQTHNLRFSYLTVRLGLRDLERQFDKSEDDIKALQSVGQIIGSVLKQLDDDRCKWHKPLWLAPQRCEFCVLMLKLIPEIVIIKAASGPRYVVGCRNKLDKSKLKLGTRVALDMTTFTIMRMLPREVDPMVYSMSMEDPGSVTFAGIGGLGEQIRELREVGAWYMFTWTSDTFVQVYRETILYRFVY